MSTAPVESASGLSDTAPFEDTPDPSEDSALRRSKEAEMERLISRFRSTRFPMPPTGSYDPSLLRLQSDMCTKESVARILRQPTDFPALPSNEDSVSTTKGGKKKKKKGSAQKQHKKLQAEEKMVVADMQSACIRGSFGLEPTRRDTVVAATLRDPILLDALFHAVMVRTSDRYQWPIYSYGPYMLWPI